MGIAELLAVLFIVLLFFGASRLPALGEGLGKALRGLRSAVNGEGVGGGGAKAPPRELPPGDDDTERDGR
jgi:TatA/E family protein of Tat protein translocase